jgi:hypothetical protein
MVEYSGARWTRCERENDGVTGLTGRGIERVQDSAVELQIKLQIKQ